MAGLFSNPLNWKVTDTLQGQEGGYAVNPFGNTFQQAATGFAYGSQPSSQISGSPTNEIYNSANQAAKQYAATDYGIGTSTGGTAAPTPEAPTQQPQQPQQPQQVADPFAQWGGKDAYNSLVNNFMSQLDTTRSSAGDYYKRAGRNLGRSITNFVDQSRIGQRNIDESRIGSEMARRAGMQGVQGMVGRGIRSGNVMLNNMNAGDSSAAGAIARAYGDIGNREMANIGNQFASAQNEANIQQGDFDLATQRQAERLRDAPGDIVQDVVADARNQIGAIEAAMVNASLPDQINMQNEINRIRNEAQAYLSQYDTQLTQGQQGLNPMAQADIRTAANERMMQGRAVANPFQFTDQMPAQLQGGPAPGGGLPIFTFGTQGRRREG